MAEGGFMRRATDVGFTLVERIAQWEREYGANIAVRDRETTYTYTELFDAARRFASCLASEGIEAGDRIVLQLPNKAESLIILFGSVMRGCIPVLALPTHRKAEISHFCSKSNASCLIVPCSSPAYDYESLAKAIKKDNPRLKCFVIGSSDQYRSVSDMRGELWQATAPHSSSILFLLPSGGTTGLPKLIPRSNFSYVYNFVEAASRSLFSEKTKYLAALSICHNLPLACPGALGALEKGGTVILAESVSPDEVFPLISSAKVTTITAVPSAVNLWMDALDWYPVDLSSLESIHVGGARFTAKDAKRLSAAFSCAVQQSYGMTEGILTLTSPEAPEEIAFTTQGFPLSENDRPLIIGQDGQPCADGEEGELIWKGPYLMSGYYEDEYSTLRSFDSEGFYHTGDLAARDPCGNFKITGRLKNTINRGGETFSAEDVEASLREMPGIVDVAVCGIPDQALGEKTCAFIVCSGDAPNLESIREFLNNIGIAPFKHPDRVEIRELLPLTPIGKIDLNALKTSIR